MSTEELLSAFDVGGRSAAEHIGTEALLFQTGYLTIIGEEDLGGETLYRLDYPNRELAPPGSALAQLRERDYAAKYRAGGEPIHLIGVEFSRESRNVTAFEVADA